MTASERRLLVAKHAANAYHRHPDVGGMIVGGSVARGCADRNSDVELGVFWQTLPPANVHRELAEENRGQQWELDPFDPCVDRVQFEEYSIDGLKIDLRHMAVSTVEDGLSAIIDRGEDDAQLHGIAYVLRHGIFVHESPLLAAWRSRVNEFPGSLAQSMVSSSLDLPPWDNLPLYAARQEWMLFSLCMAEAGCSVFRAICGINREFFPGLKWMSETISKFQLQPVDAANRLDRLFRTDPESAATDLRNIVEETMNLAERAIPGIDLTSHRANFRKIRVSPDW